MGAVRHLLRLATTRLIGVALTLILGSSAILADVPDSSRTYELLAPELSGGIIIDGDLTERAWAGAERTCRFTEASPREGQVPEVSTEVLIGFDRENLYIGFVCHEEDASRIRSAPRERDAAEMLLNDDCIGGLPET
jgi:hypothetical protein